LLQQDLVLVKEQGEKKCSGRRGGGEEASDALKVEYENLRELTTEPQTISTSRVAEQQTIEKGLKKGQKHDRRIQSRRKRRMSRNYETHERCKQGLWPWAEGRRRRAQEKTSRNGVYQLKRQRRFQT